MLSAPWGQKPCLQGKRWAYKSKSSGSSCRSWSCVLAVHRQKLAKRVSHDRTGKTKVEQVRLREIVEKEIRLVQERYSSLPQTARKHCKWHVSFLVILKYLVHWVEVFLWILVHSHRSRSLPEQFWQIYIAASLVVKEPFWLYSLGRMVNTLFECWTFLVGTSVLEMFSYITVNE